MPRGVASSRVRKASSKALAVNSLSLRLQERARVGPLSAARVRPYTLVLYNRAVSWYFPNFLCFSDIPPSVEALDDSVAEAIESAWAEGESRSPIGNFISGLQFHVPNLKGKLRFSWVLWSSGAKKNGPVARRHSRVTPLVFWYIPFGRQASHVLQVWCGRFSPFSPNL